MTLRLLLWMWQRFRPTEDWLLFFLLVSAALTAGVGVITAELVPGDHLFWHTVLVGVLIGRRLGRTRMRKRRAALLLVAGGVVYVGWWASHLTPPLWAVLGAAWHQDWPLALTWLREAGIRVTTLVAEATAWIDSWFGQQRASGPMGSLFGMAFILWGSAAFAGWSIARERHPLSSFLPLGWVLATSVYLGGAEQAFLLFFTSCVVMMAPPMTLRQEEQGWKSRQVDYSEEFRLDAKMAGLAAVAVVVVSSFALPNVRVWAVVDWFWQHTQGPQRAAEELLDRVFPDAESARKGGSWGRGVSAAWPREHLLGGNPDLGRTVVMQIVTDDPPPAPEGFPNEEWRPRETVYWRGTTYSEYVGVGWRQGSTKTEQQPPYASLEAPERPGRRPLRQEFTLLVSHGQTLYAAGDPQSVDRAVNARRQRGSDDLVAVEGREDNYHVLSLIPQVTAQQLAEAPATYPPPIEEDYLALPGDLPQRVIDLAQEVTKEAETPYARALSLETYLRSFPYDLEVAKSPEERDVVDYFLFDLQRGYCDYFASTMVVMARSVGIPARLAVGYAMGSYDFQQKAYVVTEADAHAWPELYFPDYGWIPFEPTSGLRALTLVEDAAEPVIPAGLPPSVPERSWWVRLRVESRLMWLRWRWWALAG
ncbi:MAG: transglutaminase domain-containing protein, partial [Chloroflexota bacterium]|nr:transglutaminase domain-containing protein [Chloroflexota bacterium]